MEKIPYTKLLLSDSKLTIFSELLLMKMLLNSNVTLSVEKYTVCKPKILLGSEYEMASSGKTESFSKRNIALLKQARRDLFIDYIASYCS